MSHFARAPRTTPRLAAYHEAGHAVAAYFRPRGGRTTRVSVRGPDLGRGDAGVHYCQRTLPEVPDSSSDREVVRAMAVVALAGSEVDRRLTGNAFTSGGADYEAVRELLFHTLLAREIEELVAAVTPAEARSRGLEAIAAQAAADIEDHFKQLVDSLREETRHLVEAKWPCVEAVAQALLASGALSGEEVRKIIGAVEDRG
jgi:ATP-dependent Zn protease